MSHRFSELVDVPRVQGFTDLFYDATGIPSLVRDLDGTIVTGPGRPTLCTDFHHVNANTRGRCMESIAAVTNRIKAGERHTVHQCGNGLIEAGAPIRIKGKHVANVFAGQFLFRSPDVNFFRSQAQRFDFDEEAYIKAALHLPIIDEARLPALLDYLSELAELLGEIGQKQPGQVETDRFSLKARDKMEQRTVELRDAYEALQREVEERRRVEEQLRQAHKMEAIGTLAGGIAHDFNNILAAIVGFAEIAMARAPEGPLTRPLQRIFDAGVRGRDLVRQLLTFARRSDQQKRPVEASLVLKEALKLLRPTLPSTISLHLDIKSESGLLLADGAQIQQLILNLVSNAAQAMGEEGGAIGIELSDFSLTSETIAPHPRLSPGPYLRLAVTDTGVGIGTDIRERIFDPFFTTRKPGRGTGLGLSVALSIVESHSGAITVDSTAGEGSTFTVYLPRFIGEKQIDEKVIPTGRERILFVDDEEALVEMGRELLGDLGYRVVSCSDAREALERFREDPDRFDLVITDQTMPGITGVELTRQILALRADIPVIICTGFGHAMDTDIARVAGVASFVLKPLTRMEIAQAIRKALDGQNGIKGPPLPDRADPRS